MKVQTCKHQQSEFQYLQKWMYPKPVTARVKRELQCSILSYLQRLLRSSRGRLSGYPMAWRKLRRIHFAFLEAGLCTPFSHLGSPVLSYRKRSQSSNNPCKSNTHADSLGPTVHPQNADRFCTRAPKSFLPDPLLTLSWWHFRLIRAFLWPKNCSLPRFYLFPQLLQRSWRSMHKSTLQ